MCWGANGHGQLGDGEACGSYCTTPVNVTGLASGVVAVSAGEQFTCAVTTGGGVKCWGYNAFGQIGNGTSGGNRTTPVDVLGLSDVITISAGDRHTCALTTDSGVKCWGSYTYGQIGNGGGCLPNPSLCTTPVDVTGLTSGVAAVSAGYAHTCALTTDGGVKCWGLNGYGELGNGTTTNSSMPVDVSGLTSDAAAVSAGYYHTCAVTTAGGAKCWGWNFHGELGDGTTGDPSCNYCRITPVEVSGLTTGVAPPQPAPALPPISAGGYQTCALTTGGGVKCWGSNQYGGLGNGTTADSLTPVDVSGLNSGGAAVSAGRWHTCALTTVGGIKCWGWNYLGRLGDGTTSSRTTPVDVTGFGPKPTPTPTNTPPIPSTPTPPNGATATPTPIIPTAAATGTATPTRTPTVTLAPRDGDADKNGTTNAIDAALVLQHAAGLLSSINPSADVNNDGVINSVDAALILQYSAGLLDFLPV